MKYVNEEWRDIPGYPNYRASNYGRIKRYVKGQKNRYYWRIAKLTKDKEGYLRVSVNGQSKRAHILVALAFIPNPENKPYIDHINNIHDDNRVENLRWVTAQENAQYAADMGLMDTTTKVVVGINPDDGNGYVFESTVAFSKYIDTDSRYVSKLLNGKRNQIKGWKAFRLGELIDKRYITEFDEDGIKYGTTSLNGTWAEVENLGYKIKITDESKKPLKKNKLRDVCFDLIDKFVGKEK